MSSQRVMGTCVTCKHDLWMHYTPYCPICEPPQPNEGPSEVAQLWNDVIGRKIDPKAKKGHFNLSRVTSYVEALGQPGEHDPIPEKLNGTYNLWHVMLEAQRKAGTYHGFGNDRVCTFTFDPQYYPDNPTVKAYLEAVIKVIGEPTQDFWVSW